MPIVQGLGERIRAGRRQKGLSLEELATRVGTNRRSLYSYETGLVDPKVGDLKIIAEVLGVSVCYLILGESHTRTQDSYVPKIRKIMNELQSITKEEWEDILGQH